MKIFQGVFFVFTVLVVFNNLYHSVGLRPMFITKILQVNGHTLRN